MVYIILIIGFVLLIKGADFFVDGAANIAKLLRIPAMIIGLTIVAFGTSSPEATVSIISSLQGTADVAVGNIVGSNIFNITMVVGIAAIIYPLAVEKDIIRKDLPYTLLASIVLIVFMADVTLQGAADNSITHGDGIMFLLLLGVYLYIIIYTSIKSRKENSLDQENTADVTWGKNLLITIVGLVMIIIGGQMVVKSATDIAYSLGMSEALVGLTIVAIGTSLPELVTSISAAVKGQSEIAIGNVVGSNIFNILFVLGISAVITPLPVNSIMFIDVILMLFLTVLLWIFSRTNYKVGRTEGIVFVAFYVVYMIYIIMRN